MAGFFVFFSSMLKHIIPFIFLFAIQVIAVDLNAVVPVFQDRYVPTQRNPIAQQPLNLPRVVDSTYIVGPGDFFEILTLKGLDVVQISPEGNVSIPECGFVFVDGLQLKDAKAKILELLNTKYDAKYTRVQLVHMKWIQFSVLGAVAVPGRRTADPQLRLSTALDMVGGFLPTADRKNVMIIRRGGDTLRVDYTLYGNEGNDSVNITMEQEDVVYVPFFKQEASITIEVQGTQKSLPYIPGKTVLNYLGEARIDQQMNFKWVKIKKPGHPAESFELKDVGDMALEPKTVIEFWHREPAVYVGGAVARMGRAIYNPEFHAIDYIAASGVTIVTGSWSQVSVTRDGKSMSIDPHKDEILPGDYIEIPQSRYESVKDFVTFIASLLSVVATAIIITTR